MSEPLRDIINEQGERVGVLLDGLDDLLARNAETQLSPHEITQLDQLLEQVDQLNILKTRARYTLTHQPELATAP